MTKPFIGPEVIEQMAREAFARRVDRDGHCMPPRSPAAATWQAEWDRCAEFAESVADSRVAP